MILAEPAHDLSAYCGKRGYQSVQVPHLNVTAIHKMLRCANSFVVVPAIRKHPNTVKVAVFTCQVRAICRHEIRAQPPAL